MRLACSEMLAVIVMLAGAPAYAQCADTGMRPLSVQDEFARAAVVLTATTGRWFRLIDGDGVSSMRTLGLRPVEVYKGTMPTGAAPDSDVPQYREVEIEGPVGRFGASTGPFLLFVTAKDGKLIVDACGWSDELPAATETLSKVRDIAATTRPTSSP